MIDRDRESGGVRAPRFLIAGANGMLGHALVSAIMARGGEAYAPPECTFDITEAENVAHAVEAFVRGADRPGVLLNAAAYTDVEGAEENRELAFRVNEAGPRLLAETSRSHGLGFVHISTDFIFDGEKRTPYREKDEPNPLSVYGASKLAGERAVLETHPGALVVRTAWSYDVRGNNFPLKVLGRAAATGEVQVVTDEVGSPTYVPDLAEGILDLVEAGAEGVYHLVGAGVCTRFEMAQELLALVDSEARLVPTTTAAFPSKVHRPHYAVLDCGKAAALGVTMPDWKDALERFAASLES